MIMPVYSDNEILVRGILEDELRKRGRIYKTCFDIAFKITGNKDDAEELVMLGYERAIEKAGEYDEDYEINTWLGTIVRHLAIDFVRMRYRRAESYYEKLQDRTKLLQESPVDLAIKEEDRRVLEEAVGRLPVKKRTVLIMKYFDGRSYKEIAELTECKETTVKGRVSAAKKHLRESRKLQELVA